MNVLAAGGCTLRWKGSSVPARRPEIVGFEVAREAMGGFERFAVRRLRFESFVLLQR